MNYIEVNISYNNVSEEKNEIIAAILGEIQFESFSDFENGIKAYIPKNLFNMNMVQQSLEPLADLLESINISSNEIEQQNWNEEWEKNFEPIFIDNKCRIRAPFHTNTPSFEFDIIIEPKMSFGTGHHATTSCMIKLLLNLDCSHKKVLDMGCGTGVLGILASMKKAEHVVGIDIDNWAYINSLENAQRNNIKNIELYEGDASLLHNQSFDIVLANINRNILLNDMHSYVNTLTSKGLILISGFYTEDLQQLKEKAESLGLIFQNNIEKNNWVAAQFIKKD